MLKPDSRERILQATRDRIRKDGILGLRVADIANDAETSITLIYKYYHDRDGLLAQVLGDMYDEYRLAYQKSVEDWLAQADEITLEELVKFMPQLPHKNLHLKGMRSIRLQVLATAIENPQLHERIKSNTTAAYRWIRDTLEANRHRLPAADRNFDIRFFTVIMFNLLFAYYELVDEDKLTDEDYHQFLVSQIRSSARNSSLNIG